MPKTLLASAALISLVSEAFSQVPQVIWAGTVTAGFYSTNFGTDGYTAIDAGGSPFFASSFNVPLCTVGGLTLTNASTNAGGFTGAFDSFVMKMNNSGAPVWVRQIGGGGNEFVRALATDKSGNVVASIGSTSTQLTLDGNVLTGTGFENVILTKHNSQGDLVWVRQITGGAPVLGTSLAVDTNGNILLAGIFYSNWISAPIALDKGSAAPAPFLAKFNSLGSLVWAKQFPVNDSNGPTMAVDAQGNVLMFDVFVDVADFGTGPLTNTSAQSLSITKFDTLGNAVWSREAGHSSSFIYASSAAVDAQGNCRMVGGHLTGDAVLQGTNLPIGSSYGNMFVANFDSSGNLSWVNPIVGSLEVFSRGISLDAAGNCYATGRSDGMTATVGGIVLSNVAPLYSHALAAKYDAGGHLAWAKLLNAPGAQTSGSGVVDSRGNLFICGSASGQQFLNLDGVVVSSPTNSGMYYYAAKVSGPVLNIQPVGTDVVISWPTNATGLNLESATNLAGAWSPVTNAPAVNGQSFVVTNAVAGSERYYRLRNF